MTYAAPAPAPRSNPIYTAVVVLIVVIALTASALVAVFVLGGTSDAAAPAPAQPVATSPVLEANAPLDKQDPAVAQAQAEAAQATETEAATQAPAAEAAPAPAAPVQAAPVSPSFYPTCSTSKSFVEAGELFLISGTHTPQQVSVTWAFDHGDGFIDWRNPSTAYYEYPGVYNVTGIASAANGAEQRIHCGTVTVTAATPEYDCTIENTYIEVNGNTVFHAASTHTDLPIVYTFDHGDGYREVANPSYATYYNAGTYNVSVTAFYNGVTTHIDCGTVTVVDPAPTTCPTTSLIGMTESQAQAQVIAASCTPVTVARGLDFLPIPGDYRTDRVQLVVGITGTVLAASIG